MSFEWQKNIGWVFSYGEILPKWWYFRKLVGFSKYCTVIHSDWIEREFVVLYLLYIFRALSGNPPKIKQYLMRWDHQFLGRVHPQVSTSELDWNLWESAETLVGDRCPARISALESSCLVLRGKKKPFCACPRDNNVNNTSTSTSTSTTNIISQRALPLSMNHFLHINETTIFMSLNLKPSRDRHKNLALPFQPTLHRDILWPGGLLATCPAFAQSFGEVRAAFAFLKARMMWAL